MPSNCGWVNQVMREVAVANNLDFDNDFVGMGDGDTFISDNATIYNYIVTHQNQSQNAIWFWTVSGSDCTLNDTLVPLDVGYVLFYNATSKTASSEPLILSLDTVLLQHKANLAERPNFSVTMKEFPKTPPRIQGYDVVSASQNWFYVPPMITFFLLLTEIVHEKEMRLRIGMKMMGLSNTVYWLVWFGTGIIFVVLSAMLLMLSALVAQFTVFTHANFFALFLTFLCYGISV